MCLFPKLVINKKYVANKKNGGKIPAVCDERVLQVPVGCGKCMECKKQKARNWRVRLMEEIKINPKAQFVTLSFSDVSLDKLSAEINGLSGYNLDNKIAKIAVRRFLERWRKATKKSVKHWIVTEIGGQYSERIHLHGILFTDNVKLIKEKWQYGNIFIGDYVGEKTINYIVKYLHKTDIKHKHYNSIVLTSPGLGASFVNKKTDILRARKTDTYKGSNGAITALPIYYRNKIFTEEEREKLWLKMMDEKVRYINGQKIDISKGMTEYFKALKEAQILNKQLGYGNDEIDWEQKRYEQELRLNGRKKS